MSAGFTPGPWVFLWNVPDIKKAEPTSGVCWTGKGDIKNRCRIDVSGPNTLANARLIASAPELLEALETIRHQWAGHAEECAFANYGEACDCDWTPIAKQCDAAITKARKGQS